MMSSINVVNSATPTISLVQEGRLRRQLEGKFLEIDRVIAQVVLRDPLTCSMESWLSSFRRSLHRPFNQVSVHRECIDLVERLLIDLPDSLTGGIENWLNSFQAHLARPLNEEIIYEYYIGILQCLLRDSFNGAPLDTHACLGVENGCTYGSMTVAVMRTAFPDHDVSPTTEEPLTLVPHTVARYVAAWLEELGESLYSPELVETYLDLLPQESEAVVEARLQNRVDAMMQMHVQRQAQNQEGELTEWQRLEARVSRMEQEHASDTQRMAERIACLTQPLQQVQGEVQQVAASAISIPVVRQEMQRLMNEAFVPLEQRVREYAVAHPMHLTQVAEQERQRLVCIEENLTAMHNRVRHIQSENVSLEQEQGRLQQNITQVVEQQRQLDHAIYQLHEAITRKKERQEAGLWRSIACVALSVIVTWGLSCLEIPASLNIGGGSIGGRIAL